LAVLESIENAILWLQKAKQELEVLQNTSPTPASTGTDDRLIAWGAKVSPVFKERVIWIADNLSDENYQGDCASDLMACMAWEDAETFKPNTKNVAGSGATGLIQFMPSTAVGLGTTVAALAKMTAEEQLKYVYDYFKPYAGRIRNLGDLYMAILWPKGVGQPDSYVLFDRSKTPTTFRQNAGLDTNHDGLVTRAECLVKVNQKLAKGLQKGYVG
jgi:hypothetical protein